MVRRQIPSPAIARANASGSSRLRLYSSQRAGAQISAWSRDPTRAPRSRGRRTRAGPAGRGPGPGVELGLERAGEQLTLQQPRVRIGHRQARRPCRRARLQAVIGKIARQLSSHRATTAPSASCPRNRAGTAIRPLPSTACRYSPVNTVRASPYVGRWKGWLPGLVARADRSVRRRRRGRAVGAFPRLRASLTGPGSDVVLSPLDTTLCHFAASYTLTEASVNGRKRTALRAGGDLRASGRAASPTCDAGS